MATQTAVLSFRIQDDVGVVKAFEDYVSYDDATATLASIAAAVSAEAALLDAITDGQIMSASLRLQYTLPGGLKAAPVADSDCEETGLFSYTTSAPGSKVYGSDIPAFAQSKFIGKTIDTADADVSAWTTAQLNQAGTLKSKDNKWAYNFTGVKSAQKTFRKLRRALKKA